MKKINVFVLTILSLFLFAGCFFYIPLPPSSNVSTSTASIPLPTSTPIFSKISWDFNEDSCLIILKIKINSSLDTKKGDWWIDEKYIGKSTRVKLGFNKVTHFKEIPLDFFKFNQFSPSHLRNKFYIIKFISNFSLVPYSDVISIPEYIINFTPIPTPTPTNTPLPSPTPTPTPLPPIARTILLENGNEKTNKTKPQISIFAENAVYMAFSGNSLEWTGWIPYATLYNNFDLNSSPGCIEGDGEKSIYVKFKNEYNQESNIISDTIILDTTPPNPPIVNGSITPTRKDIQILSGTKDRNASLWIGNTQIIPINDETTWSYTVTLLEGENTYEFYSKDDLFNESNHTIVTIIYDPTIYVSPGGSDTEGTGTETKPYKTITYAISKTSEGDALFIKNGLYEENLIIDKPLTIQGESQEGVIIKSDPSPPQDMHSVVRIASSNVTIEDITIDGNNTPIEIYDGVTVISNEDMATNNILLMNLMVSNFNLSSSSGIHFSSNTSGIINSSIVKNNTKGIRAGGVPGATLIISDCDMVYNTEGIYIEDSGMVNAGDETDNTPGRNNIYGNTSHGMANYSTNILFAKNNWWGDPDGPKYPYNSNNENCGDWAFWPTNGKKIEISSYSETEFVH